MSIYQLRNYFIFFLLIPGIGIYSMGLIANSILGLLGLICLYIVFSDKNVLLKVNFKYFVFIVLCTFSFLINSVNFNISYYIIICFLIALSFLDNNNKSIDHLITMFKWIVILNILYAILQYFYTNQFDEVFFEYLGEKSLDNYHFGAGRLTTVWKEAPRLGCFMNALTPFLCVKYLRSKKKIDLLLLIAISVLVLLTISRISIIVCAFILLHYFTKFKWRLSYTIIIMVLLALVYTGIKEYFFDLIPSEFSRLFESQNDFDEDSKTLNRGLIFLMLVPLVGQSFLLGSGFDYKLIIAPYGFSSPHNTLLELFLVYGVPLTIWLLAIVIKRILPIFADKGKLALMNYSQAASISILSILLVSVFHGIYFDLPIFLVLWISIFVSLENRFS